MSEFIDSVDDMIARHFAFDTMRALRNGDREIKNWASTEEILNQLIRAAIAHARSQIEGRKTGTMTFTEAMKFLRSRNASVTRPYWNIFRAVRRGDDGLLEDWMFDNCDGSWSGLGKPYNPTDEDRSASDWMFYQAPDENWVELEL